MTNPDDWWERAEHDLRTSRTLSAATRESAASLSVERRSAFANAMNFIGSKTTGELPVPAAITVEADRIKAAKLMLLELGLDSTDPRWSSWVLDRMLQAVVETPGGTVGDPLHALNELLGEHAADVATPVANFIKAVVVASFTRHRKSYESLDWSWLADEAADGYTPAQAYLALLALPPGESSPACAVAILRGLEATPYWEDAVASLEEDVQNEEGRRLLQQWLEEGIRGPQARDVERMLGQA